MKHKISISGYVLICIFSSFFSLASPYISGNFIDLLVTSKNTDFLIYYCLIFAILSLGGIILSFICNRIYTKLQINIVYELSRDIIQHIQQLPISYSTMNDTAYLSQRINTDTSAVITFCIGIIQNILINSLMFTVPLVMLLSFNISIAFVLIILIIVYLITYNLFKKPLFKNSYEYREKQSVFFNKLHEQLLHIKFIKRHGMSNCFVERLKNTFKYMINSALKYQKISYLFSGLDNMIMTLTQLALFIFGGVEVIRGNLTIGQFTIISSYFIMMMGAIRYFFNLGKVVQDSLVSYNRLMDIVNIQPETNGALQIDRVDMIQANDLTFSYADKLVLNHFSATFQKGNIYTIVGMNGSGKTTLVSLLLGLYIDENQGDILYNGIPIQQIDMQHARRELIGISEQEPVVIGDTIRYNLLLSEQDELNDMHLIPLLSMLGLDEYINKLSCGLDTILDEKASNLSGGEKQKISILRVLLKNPNVMILDEPTSALDENSRERLQAYLKSIKHEKIIIIITHDVFLIDICDKSLMLYC